MVPDDKRLAMMVEDHPWIIGILKVSSLHSTVQEQLLLGLGIDEAKDTF